MPVALDDQGKEFESGELEEAPELPCNHADYKADLQRVTKDLLAMLNHKQEQEEAMEVSSSPDHNAEEEGSAAASPFVKKAGVCPFVCCRMLCTLCVL